MTEPVFSSAAPFLDQVRNGIERRCGEILQRRVASASRANDSPHVDAVESNSERQQFCKVPINEREELGNA